MLSSFERILWLTSIFQVFGNTGVVDHGVHDGDDEDEAVYDTYVLSVVTSNFSVRVCIIWTISLS